MSSKIQIGDHIIMNDADKPCTRLIAQVIELPEGKDFVRARYICERTNMREPYGRLSGATLVSDFGVEMTFDGDTVTDGKRCWPVLDYSTGIAEAMEVVEAQLMVMEAQLIWLVLALAVIAQQMAQSI